LVCARGPADAARMVVLCAECAARAMRGEFSVHRMQVWKVRLMEYWDNVGAE